MLIGHMLAAGIARQAGDVAGLAREAAWYEPYSAQEAITWIAAQAALLWVGAGEPGRARLLLHQLAGPDFGGIPRDLDWLLTMVVSAVDPSLGRLLSANVTTGTICRYDPDPDPPSAGFCPVTGCCPRSRLITEKAQRNQKVHGTVQAGEARSAGAIPVLVPGPPFTQGDGHA